MLRESLGLFLLFSLALHVAASGCSRHAHCDDGNPDTHDVCMREHSLCLSFSGDRQSTNVVLPLEDLIRELNEGRIATRVKKRIAKIAGTVLGEWNPNLFVYRNVAGTDPSVRLRRYARTITRGTSSFEFQNTMGNIFRAAHDSHTSYFLPAPFSQSQARLGFEAQVFYVKGDNDKEGNPRRRYVVDDIMQSLIPTNLSFGVGAELLTYNGNSIDAAVLAAGRLSYGANLGAQVAEGVRYISSRQLIVHPVPGSAAVKIGYRTAGGSKGSITLPWLFMRTRDRGGAAAAAMIPRRHKRGAATGEDDLVWRGGRNESKIEIEIPANAPTAPETVRVAESQRQTIAVAREFQAVFFAETIGTKAGRIGHLQIKTFVAKSNSAILNELARLLRAMPARGLVVDIRNNGGGSFVFAEDAANVITGGVAPGFPGSWRGTALVRDAFLSLGDVGDGESSVLAAVQSAITVREPMSGPTLPLFQRNELDTGGFYGGPIVTLTDASTYSAADMFTALQVDLRLSSVVGMDAATGGGGAGVIDYENLVNNYPKVFTPLGTDAGTFRTAQYRFFRYGINKGALIESVGVAPNMRYFRTRDDVLNRDCDLYEMLGVDFGRF